MSQTNTIPDDLVFYLSAPHPCSYLEDEEATSLFVDPDYSLQSEHYSQLAQHGFRRSGNYLYMPRCSECQQCLPVRIPVAEFAPNRSQRRNSKKNADISTRIVDSKLTQEQFELYQLYIADRHPDGSMQVDDLESCRNFFLSHWSESIFIEFRGLSNKLLAVAVTDILENGLSAVYTFFDPMQRSRGLGVMAIQRQMEICRERQLPFLFLGYLIHNSPKMAYKADFRPLQILLQGRWITLA